MYFKIFLLLILLYLIYRVDSQPITSKKGEKAKLYHGPVVSARWKERNDKKQISTFLWILLFLVLLSFFQK